MQSINTHKIVAFDCDDTMIMWDASKYPKEEQICIEMYGYKTYLHPNQKNINLLIKFAKLGFTVILWSQTGFDWAEAVAKSLNLTEYVTYCMTKPRYYVDDLKADAWMHHIYREAQISEEE